MYIFNNFVLLNDMFDCDASVSCSMNSLDLYSLRIIE